MWEPEIWRFSPAVEKMHRFFWINICYSQILCSIFEKYLKWILKNNNVALWTYTCVKMVYVGVVLVFFQEFGCTTFSTERKFKGTVRVDSRKYGLKRCSSKNVMRRAQVWGYSIYARRKIFQKWNSQFLLFPNSQFLLFPNSDSPIPCKIYEKYLESKIRNVLIPNLNRRLCFRSVEFL